MIERRIASVYVFKIEKKKVSVMSSLVFRDPTDL